MNEELDTSMFWNLRQGDCLEVMKDIPDKSIDMILCDLPYGTTRNKWDSVIPLDKLWEQYERIIKDNGAIVLFSQMPFSAELVRTNLKLFKYEWIWQEKKKLGYNALHVEKFILSKKQFQLRNCMSQQFVQNVAILKRSIVEIKKKIFISIIIHI